MLKMFSRRGLAALLSQLLPQRHSVSLRSRRRGAAAAKQLAPKDKRDAEIDAARLFPLPREPIMRATALAPFFCLPPFPLRLRRSFGAVIEDINPATVGVDETDVLKAFASFIIVFTFAFVLGGWFLMPHLPPVPNHRISVFEIEYWTTNWAGALLGLFLGGLSARAVLKKRKLAA